MLAPNFITRVPGQIQYACGQIFNTAKKPIVWIGTLLKAGSDNIKGTDWWKHTIVPLNRTDFSLIGGSIATAFLVVAAAIKRLGIAAFPIGAGFGTILVIGSGMYSRHRVRKHFDKIAWRHVDNIRRAAYFTHSQTNQLTLITQERASLRDPQFKHLDLKALDKEIYEFKKIASSPTFESLKKIVDAHFDDVKKLVQTSPSDLQLIENLEKEIKRLKTNDSDPGALETQKLKLNEVQSDQVLTEIKSLKDQVDELVKAAPGPTFEESKSSFIEYLLGFQKTLDPDGNPVKDLSQTPPSTQVLPTIDNPIPTDNPINIDHRDIADTPVTTDNPTVINNPNETEDLPK